VNFDVYQHGIPAMEAMRLVDDENGYRIGGFIAHTLFKTAGLETNIIHVWPDAIGERIKAHGLALGGPMFPSADCQRASQMVNALKPIRNPISTNPNYNGTAFIHQN
jgi:hypothetical protein